MNIYEMSPEELNDTYQEVISKHLEAEEASRIMRSVGELKSQRENWIDFEKTYPPKADESKKIAFLNLMKAPSKVNDESKNNDESKYEQKLRTHLVLHIQNTSVGTYLIPLQKEHMNATK